MKGPSDAFLPLALIGNAIGAAAWWEPARPLAIVHLVGVALALMWLGAVLTKPTDGHPSVEDPQ